MKRTLTPLAAVVCLALSACAHGAPGEEASWRKPTALAARITGGTLAVAGPAVVIGGILLDHEPTSPPVEAFVVGAALATAGVAAVIAGGVIADDQAPAG